MNKLRLLFTGILLTFFVSAICSNVRDQFTINSYWKFKKGDIGVSSPEFGSESWEIVSIPHTWNDKDVMDEADGFYRGIGWYSKTFNLSEKHDGKKVFIKFEGANQIAEVYVNGSKVGKHIGGYTAFIFDITKYVKVGEKNELAVKLDNRHNEMVPPLSADFTFFGGIYRDVYIITTDNIHFEMPYGSKGVFIQTPEVTDNSASIRIFGSVKNSSEENRSVKVVNTITNEANKVYKEIETTLKVKAGESESFDSEETGLTDFVLWSPENPYLYMVSTKIIDKKSGKIIDEVVNPLGFRYFSITADKGAFLNGENIKLHGANRHQDFKDLGNALPDYYHEKDMRLFKEMGGNFMRVAHYPQDEAVVEALDEYGILASIEIPLVNYITEDEEFYTNTMNMLKEMQHQYYNHPSIVIWCYANEVLLRRPFRDRKLEPNLCDREREYMKNLENLARNLDDELKENDPYRPTMISHHQWFPVYDSARLTRIPDIVGWNLYPGWYGKTFEMLDTFLIKEHHEKLPTKPVIISEYGAGSDPRIRTNEPIRFDFSIEWMNKYHEYYIDVIDKYDFVAGGAIWNLVEFNSEGREDAVPHVNQKGVLTYDRKPKDIYWYYKSRWNNEPEVRIAPVLSPERAGMQDEGEEYTSTRRIWIYTNLEMVELIANGKSLGRVEAENYKAFFDVPFIDGENKLEARAVKGGKIYQDFQRVNFKVYPQDLTDERFKEEEILISCGSNYHFTDNFGQVWLKDKEYEKGNFGYIGGERYERWPDGPGGNDDIFGTEDDPLYQTQRINPESYKFDVEPGYYEVTLRFAENLTVKDAKKLLYNLGSDNVTDKAVERVFSVKINDKIVVDKLNLRKQISEMQAYDKKYRMQVEKDEGITISFESVKGDPIINGIKVRKMYK